MAFARYRRSEISLRLRIDSVGRNRAGQLWVLNQRLRLPIEGGRLVDVWLCGPECGIRSNLERILGRVLVVEWL